MNKFRRLLLILATSLALSLIIVFTNPYKLPLLFLVIPFALIGFGCYLALSGLMRLGSVSARKRKLISAILSTALLLILLMQSIRQLCLKDVLILLALLAGITFYIRRLDIKA